MKRQTIIKNNPNDLLFKESEPEVITVTVGNKEKIWCKEPYVTQEMINAYNGSLGEKSFQQIVDIEQNTHGVVNASIANITNDNDGNPVKVDIDLSPKHSISCDLRRESVETRQGINLTDNGVISLELVKKGNGEFNTSMGNAIRLTFEKELMDAIKNRKTAYEGTIESLGYGGFTVSIRGIKCFMPCTLTTVYKVQDFSKFVGQKLYVLPVAFAKGSIVVSHKDFLECMIPSKMKEVSENQKEIRTGYITEINTHGIFVAFEECLTGLIAPEMMDEETTRKYNNFIDKVVTDDKLDYGQDINFFIDEIQFDNRIVLSQNNYKDELWATVGEKYKVGEYYEGRVKRVVSNGYIIELEPNITAFITKKSKLEASKNDIVRCKINSIDVATRVITLYYDNPNKR